MAATLATRARLASARSILHNGPPARTRVRPSLLDLCHGTGRSNHAAAPAIVLGAYLSTHRARRVACHKPVSAAFAAATRMLQTRTCACARRALHQPPDRTSVRAAQIHLSPALATVGWAVGAVRLAAAATLEAVAARMRRTVRAGPDDGPAIFATTRGMIQLRQPTARGAA